MTLPHAPLFIDVAGLELTPLERKRLRDPLVGGVILFARNWESRRQLVALNAQIKAARADLVIAVDHEGGRVQRFRSDGFTVLPPMASLGRLWMRDPMRAVQAAGAVGRVLGAELRACGIDMSFTPVVDLDWGRSQVIGERALHSDARVVALLAQALIAGLQAVGLSHCLKHFPGHGWAEADSHVALPVDRRALSRIVEADAAPYGWLRHGARAVMPAHVVYPRVDPLPAGFSRRWLQQVLRERLGFQGAIISDDLTMQGAREAAGDTVQALLAALGAGCDMALACNLAPLDGGAPLDACIAGLREAEGQGRWQADAQGAARRAALLATQVPLGWEDLMLDAAYVAALDEVAALA
ncbi:beta-N-acetylhexosaminidase [Thiomonas sp. FB-6]|uniref:beta-N-acetylhexosaminidase n=1 Tax=Thiomonas sp. FB-6 TaxID=1158291 RepID=UPI0003767990|nr:beta-N-acetylhexosaminidase [Thiomonas sp. FB-6]